MAALSKILRSIEGGQIGFWCPGCDGMHAVGVGAGAGSRWGYNGDPERPTFTPSILVRGTQPLSDEEHARVMRGEAFEPKPLVCHSFVSDGRIQFLSDCTHALAGQTVDIPPFDEH
jgi:Family of unknown function (DUF6527)